MGGLDEYLLNTSDKKLASDVGMLVRQQIGEAMNQQREQARAAVGHPTLSSVITLAMSKDKAVYFHFAWDFFS